MKSHYKETVVTKRPTTDQFYASSKNKFKMCFHNLDLENK